MFRLLCAVSIVVCVSSLPHKNSDGPNVNNVYLTEQTIEFWGYTAETHQVITEDGYILDVHRIPHRRYETAPAPGIRPVVFLMHGLMSASNAFILLGPDTSIAFNFADAGFDVWLGNARGNKNARKHVALNPDDDMEKFQFFNFTWEEIGFFDVAATVDYILRTTGRQNLHYVGHSQGGTVFLVLNSMRPEYNAKFASAHLLAGVGYQDYFPNEEMEESAHYVDAIYAAALVMGVIELYPPGAGLANDKLMKVFYKMGLRNAIEEIVPQHFVARGVRIDLEDMLVTNDAVGGGSLKQYAHYGQNIRDKLFRRYHHGYTDNMRIYGTPEPPLYNISRVTVETCMHYTINDYLLDERDVLAMVADMPNAVTRRVARDDFLHGDFALAEDVNELVTPFMIEAIICAEGVHRASAEEITSMEEIEIVLSPEPDSATNAALSVIFKVYFGTCCLYYLLN